MKSSYPDFLEGFNKRMQISAASDSVINRKNRNMDIENRFTQGDIENILFSVLVFIMEKTLSEESDCTIQSISEFLDVILPFYNNPDIDTMRLAEYLVKDILQNGGEPRFYNIMDYSTGKREYRVKLIDDKVLYTEKGYKVKYMLTDQGYDFLFRTKEVEDEISFTIEELKLKELIKRKNYRKAVSQSRSLVQMVRQKKSELMRFLEKLRENIYSVDIGEYETIIKGTYDLLQDEYKVMKEIHRTVRISEMRFLKEENAENKSNEELVRARESISEILKNIDRTISEQRELIIDRHNLSEIYLNTIRDSFTRTIERRFDIEDEVLTLLEKTGDSKYNDLWKLFNPLFRPDIKNILNILKLYEKQYKLREREISENSDMEENIDLNDNNEELLNKERNRIYSEIVENILDYGQICRKFRFSDFFGFITGKYQDINRFKQEERIFRVFLKLYDIGYVDISEWKTEKENCISGISGEFDIKVCLSNIEETKPDLLNIRSIKISVLDDKLFETFSEIEENNIKILKKITVSDYEIEVENG